MIYPYPLAVCANSALARGKHDLSLVNESESFLSGARCSFVVERPLRVRKDVGSIFTSGPIDLFIIAASATRLV